MKRHTKKLFGTTALMSALLLVAGCGSDKKEHGCTSCSYTSTASKDGKVLATVNGKPLVTDADFNAYVDQIVKLEPQMELYFAMVPDMRKKLFDAYVTDQIIAQWLDRSGKSKDADYQERRAMQLKLVESSLQGQAFQQYVAARIDQSDAAVETFFNENKETLPLFQQAPFVKVQGGTKVEAVSFADEKQAKAFLAKVQAPEASFSAIAKEGKKTINTFGGQPVNAQSKDIDSALRAKIDNITDVPSIQLLPVDKKFWVVRAIAKTATEYASFAEVKEAAKNVLAQTKFSDELNKSLEELKKEYNIDDSAAANYFEEESKKKQADMQAQLEALQREQEAAEAEEVAAEAEAIKAETKE